MKLRSLVPNSYINVSVSDLYIPNLRSVCLFGCSKIGRLILGIYKWLTDMYEYMNVETGTQNIIILFWKY